MSLGILSRIFAGLTVVFTMFGCSSGTDAVNPDNKPNLAPVTTISPNQTYISHEKDIELSCVDVNKDPTCTTYYSWEGPDPQPNAQFEYTTRFKVGEDPQYADGNVITVKYFSVDKFDAQEKVQQKDYILDKTAPVAKASHLEGKYNTAINLEFTCSDPDLASGTPGSGCSRLYYFTSAVPAVPTKAEYTSVAIDDTSVYQLPTSINSNTYVYFFAEDQAGSGTLQVVQTRYYEFVPLVENVVNFMATAGDASVMLSWDNPTAVPNQNIMIRRTEGVGTPQPSAPDQGQLVYDGASISPVVDPLSPQNGVTYHYGAFAYDGNNQFAIGVFTEATPAVNPPSAEVSNLSYPVSNATVTISWTNPLSTDFSHVVIRRSETQDPASILDGADVSVANAQTLKVVDSSLVNGTLYYYRIFTVDIDGIVSAGLPFEAMPMDLAPNNVPNLAATAGDGFVDLSWANPADNGEGDLLGIKIVRTENTPPTAHDQLGATIIIENTDLTLTTLKDSAVTNGKTYYYAAYAYDSAVEPNYSLQGTLSAAVKPADVTPPADVTGLKVSIGNQNVLLEWTNPTDTDFAGVRILRKTVTAPDSPTDAMAINVFEGSAQSVSFNDIGLTNETPYYYAIYAFDEVPNYSVGAHITAIPTVDALAPVLTAVTPLDMSVDVNPKLPLQASFSKAVQLPTLTDAANATWSVTSPNGSVIDGIVTMDGTSTTIVKFAPTAGQLPLATTITANLQAGIIDLSGNAPDFQFPNMPSTWSFTTADGAWDVTPQKMQDIVTPYSLESSVAMDNNGNAIAVWHQRLPGVGETLEVLARLYDKTTGWDFITPPKRLNVFGFNASSPVIKMDNKGNAIVVFKQDQGSSAYYEKRLYAIRNINGVWDSAPVLITTDDTVCLEPNSKLAIDIDVSGVTSVVWSQGACALNATYQVWAKRFVLETANWPPVSSPAVPIGWAEGNAAQAQVVADDKGNAIAIWNQYYPDPDPLTKIPIQVLYNRYDAVKGMWTPPADPNAIPNVHPLNPISNNAFINDKWIPRIGAVKQTGDAIAVWCHHNVPVSTEPSVDVLWASRYNIIDDKWTVPTNVSTIDTSSNYANCGDTSISRYNIAVHNDGSAIVIWPGNGSSFETHANRYDPTLGIWQGDLKFSTKTMYDSVVKYDNSGNALLMTIGFAARISIYRYINGTNWDLASILQPILLVDVQPPITDPTVPLAFTYDGDYLDLAVDTNGNATAMWNVWTQNFTTKVIENYDLMSSQFNFKVPTP